MNMKYILIAFILIISMISLGCVDKSSGDSTQENGTTDEQVQVNPTITDGKNVDSESVSETDNASAADGEHISENDNVSSEDNESVSTDDEPTSEVVNDTSVTEIFKIGEQKNMLGVNIKLVDITDYDNNTATISIDNKQYKYSPELEDTIKAKAPNGKNIDILDISTTKEDKTAEITVDYESVSDNESTNDSSSTGVSDESTPSDIVESTNDTSVTETFNIGDQKNMLGADIKLIKIIDFNSNAVTLDINNTEYKYDPSSGEALTVEVNGTTIEVVDLVTVEENNTVEITVDYAKK